MRTPSSSEVQTRPCPPLADRFILGFPIDYGPVLLLMPFGFHLAMDSLPSEVQQAVALGRSWPYPAFTFVPFRRLHTFHFLRPARLEPRFLDISALI